jgi:hypothetical protein
MRLMVYPHLVWIGLAISSPLLIACVVGVIAGIIKIALLPIAKIDRWIGAYKQSYADRGQTDVTTREALHAWFVQCVWHKIPLEGLIVGLGVIGWILIAIGVTGGPGAM